MNWSGATASPVFEELRRSAALGVLARDESGPGPTRDDDPAAFSHDRQAVRPLATAYITESADNSTGARGMRLIDRIALAKLLAPAYVGGSIDTSDGDPCTSLVNRILAATQHDEIIDVMPLLGLRTIAERLDYLYEISGDDDSNGTRMTLTSLRALALFFVSEPQRDEPNIGISPDGHLLAEWRVRDGGILAMKFLPDGLIQFAAVWSATAVQRPLRIHGTLPKDQATGSVRALVC